MLLPPLLPPPPLRAKSSLQTLANAMCIVPGPVEEAARGGELDVPPLLELKQKAPPEKSGDGRVIANRVCNEIPRSGNQLPLENVL